MDLSVSNNLIDQAAYLRQPKTSRAPGVSVTADTPEETSLPAVIGSGSPKASGAKIIDEKQEDLPQGGYRLTRTFENSEGRAFTKIEEFSLTERGSKKTVVQQNPSGSITRYEEVLDRESTGNFRRTQRFQDSSGDIATHITDDYQVTNPYILTGGQSSSRIAIYSPYNSLRGTQLDLSA